MPAEDLPGDDRDELAMRAMHAIDPTFERVASRRVEREEIVVLAYDTAWPAAFEEWRQRLARALPNARRVEHIGSTSVPGLAAKPIIDVQVSVDDLEEEPAYVAALEAIGMQLGSRDAERRYFRRPSGQPDDVHVHVVRAGSDAERRHLLFRDHLRTSAAARGAYLAAKLAAAARWRDDRIAYTEAKGAVIRMLTAEAMADARH